MCLDEGERGPAKIAEDKCGAVIGRLLQRKRCLVQQQQRVGGRRKADQQQSEQGLQCQAGENRAPGDG